MSKIVICVDDGEGRTLHRWVTPEAAEIFRWLLLEREHQVTKFGFAKEDEERALQGLDEDSWFWQRAILNYGHRVRQFGVTGPAAQLGVQALLKIVTSLCAQVEALLRGRHVELPKPGLSSGNLE